MMINLIRAENRYHHDPFQASYPEEFKIQLYHVYPMIVNIMGFSWMVCSKRHV